MTIFDINKKTIMEYLNLNEIGKSCPAALTQEQSSNLSHQFRVMHKGFQKNDVLKAISMTTEKIPYVIGNVQNMMSKELSKSQQYDFAKIAAEQRWGEDKMIDLNQMLQVRRTEDAGDDLWSVFNRVQENMLQGGILTVTPKENGKVRNSRSRAIRSINQNLEVNKMLWTLSETMM